MESAGRCWCVRLRRRTICPTREFKAINSPNNFWNSNPLQISPTPGVLKIRDANGSTSEFRILFENFTTVTNWQSFYHSEWIPTKDHRFVAPNLTISHGLTSNSYRLVNIYVQSPSNDASTFFSTNLSGAKIMIPFADSDFWIADLGLEFFHWPEQKILKKEIRARPFARFWKAQIQVRPRTVIPAWFRGLIMRAAASSTPRLTMRRAGC